jgi:hypothetical protein
MKQEQTLMGKDCSVHSFQNLTDSQRHSFQKLMLSQELGFQKLSLEQASAALLVDLGSN